MVPSFVKNRIRFDVLSAVTSVLIRNPAQDSGVSIFGWAPDHGAFVTNRPVLLVPGRPVVLMIEDDHGICRLNMRIDPSEEAYLNVIEVAAFDPALPNPRALVLSIIELGSSRLLGRGMVHET